MANPVSNGGIVIALGDGTELHPGRGDGSGAGPTSIAVGDFDQDGDLDLAVANSGFASTTVSLFRGDGQGASTPSSVESSWTPMSVLAADVDLDGTLDLVIGYYNTNRVAVLLGRASLYVFSFRFAFGSPVFVSGDRVRLVLADFDRDGRPDLAAATHSTTAVNILLNRSEGTACPTSGGCSLHVCDPSTGGCHAVPKTAGSSCDDQDLCTANDSCLQGSCMGTAVTCVALDLCHRPGICHPAAGCSDLFAPDGTGCDDANACTRADVCDGGICVGDDPVPCSSDSQCKVGVCDPLSGACGLAALPEGTPCDDGAACTAGDACHAGACVSGLSFINPPGSPIPVGTHPSSLAIADLNGDGNEDLAVANMDSDNITLLAGDGAGEFTVLGGSPVAVPRLPSSIATGDFDHDGRTDLVATSSYSIRREF